MLVAVGPRLGVALLLLAGVAAAASAVGRLGHDRRIVVAAGRAACQLTVVSVVVAGVLGSRLLTGLFLVVMYVVATRTCGRRLASTRSGWWAAAPILAGTVPVIGGLLVGGLVLPTGLAVIPVSGVLVGGAMPATSLAGRRALDDLAARRGEVEAALSVGLSDRDAVLEICGPAAAQALTQCHLA
jgi:putative ABC transport system permease protein